MTTINDSNMFDDLISELKGTFGFKQVLFKQNIGVFVFFEGLRDGNVIEIRHDGKDNHFEFWDGQNWV